MLPLADEDCNMLTRARRKYAEVANPSWKPPSKVSRRALLLLGRGQLVSAAFTTKTSALPFSQPTPAGTGSASPNLRIFAVTLSLQATAKMHHRLIRLSSGDSYSRKFAPRGVGDEVGA